MGSAVWARRATPGRPHPPPPRHGRTESPARWALPSSQSARGPGPPALRPPPPSPPCGPIRPPRGPAALARPSRRGRSRPRPGPRSHWPAAAPAAVCLGFPATHWTARVLPGSLKKKKKKFYGRMEGAGTAPGKGRAGGAAAGGREGRRLRGPRAAEPGPKAASTFLPPATAALGRRHDGECPRQPPAPQAGRRATTPFRAQPFPSGAAPSSFPGG